MAGTLAVALAVAAGGTLAALEISGRLSGRPSSHVTNDGVGWMQYRVREFASSIAVPPGWHVQRFREDIAGMYNFSGVLLSNVDFAFEHPDLPPGRYTNAWDMRGLPANAAVVMFSHGVRIPICNEKLAETEFPLSLEQARPANHTEDAYGEPQPRLHRPFTVGGDPLYAVDVWFGADVSAGDRSLTETVVASIGKPKPLTCDFG